MFSSFIFIMFMGQYLWAYFIQVVHFSKVNIRYACRELHAVSCKGKVYDVDEENASNWGGPTSIVCEIFKLQELIFEICEINTLAVR